jgi:putative ABC transport system ATP-binding protein
MIANRRHERPGRPGRPVAVSARSLVKVYERGDVTVRALDGVDLDVEAGSFLAIVGPSGSGKSTLLHVLSALDRPSAGDVMIAGRWVARCNDDQLSDLRRTEVGFVFQFFNLLPTLSAWENVALPAVFGGARLRKLRRRADELLDRVGMGHRSDHRPSEMSGGQLQRVAIARALMTGPSVVVADEPTGNLDSAAGEQVLDLLGDLVHDGMTLVMVTHSAEAAGRADRVVHIRDGRVAWDGVRRPAVPTYPAAYPAAPTYPAAQAAWAPRGPRGPAVRSASGGWW